MQETSKYKLKKPEASDYYNVADQNENMDKIEAALDTKFDKSGGAITGAITMDSEAGIEAAKGERSEKVKVVSHDVAADCLWIGGGKEADAALLSGDVNIRLGDNGKVKTVRGAGKTESEVFDQANFTPGSCDYSTTNQYSGGTHTHEIRVTNQSTTAHQGTFYLKYDAEDYVARMAGYRDASANKDYAQIALVNEETGSRVNSVDVYPDTVKVLKNLETEGNITAKGKIRLKAPTYIMGTNNAGQEIMLFQAGVNSGDNLWIGIGNSEAATPCHAGKTYISAGLGGEIRAVLKETGKEAVTYEILHKGNTRKLLWSGSVSSSGGKMTMPDGWDNFSIYAIKLDGSNSIPICYRWGSSIRGLSAYTSGTASSGQIEIINITSSGNTLTCNGCVVFGRTSTTQNTGNITAVYGII